MFVFVDISAPVLLSFISWFVVVVAKDGGEVMERNDAATKTDIPINDSIFIDLFISLTKHSFLYCLL